MINHCPYKDCSDISDMVKEFNTQELIEHVLEYHFEVPTCYSDSVKELVSIVVEMMNEYIPKSKIHERIKKFEKELYDIEYTQEIYTQADYIKLIIWELRDLIKLDS